MSLSTFVGNFFKVVDWNFVQQCGKSWKSQNEGRTCLRKQNFPTWHIFASFRSFFGAWVTAQHSISEAILIWSIIDTFFTRYLINRKTFHSEMEKKSSSKTKLKQSLL